MTDNAPDPESTDSPDGLPRTAPDSDVPFLSRDDAERVRSLFAAALERNGKGAAGIQAGPETAGPGTYSYWNAAVQCARANDDADWAQLIDEHVTRMLRAQASDPFAELSFDEAVKHVYCRLYPRDSLSAAALADLPHRALGEDLVEVLVLDQPDAVHAFNHADADRFGYDYLHAHALTNLGIQHSQMSPEGRGELEGDIVQATNFTLCVSASGYTGSRALILPDILAGRRSGQQRVSVADEEAAKANGWLVSIPSHNQVAWRIVRGPGILEAVSDLAWLAQASYDDGIAPLSPHVYWWDGHEYQQLTTRTAAGEVEVHISEKFQEVLDRADASS